MHSLPPRDLVPEFRLTESGVVCSGRAKIAYESIEAITFKLVPPLRNRLSRDFYGIDASRMIGGSHLLPQLALHLVGGETMALFTGWEFQASMSPARMQAICGAAEFLLERTFARRFGRYRAQFAAEDRFSFGRYHFYRNGDIFKGGRRLYNLHDGGFYSGLGDFHIHFECRETPIQKLLSLLGQSGDTVDLGRDRDCFLSMYRLAYGIFWTDEQYRDDARAPDGGE